MDLASLQTVLEGFPGLVIVSDRAANIIYVNDASHPLIDTGRSASSSDLRLIDEFAEEFNQYHKRLCLTGSEHCELTRDNPFKPGERLQVIGYCQVLAGGSEVFISQFPADVCKRLAVTSRLSKNSELGISNRRYRTLLAINEVTERMIKHQPLEELLQMVAERLIDLTHASTTFIHLVRPHENRLELVVSVGRLITPIGQRLKPGQGLAGMAWQTGSAAYVEDYSKLSARIKHISNIKQACALPMVSEGSVYGVLGMMFTDETESIADQIDLLQQFANLTNVAIQNARMMEETRVELRQTQSLTELAEKIAACETIPALISVASRSIVESYGMVAVDAWEMKNGSVDNAIGAWELQEGKVAICSDSQIYKQRESLNLWLDNNSVLIQSLRTLGFASMPFFEISSFANNGYSTIALLDHGKPWALLRLKCEETEPPSERAQHLLFSVVTHLSTAARLLRMLDQANFRAGHDPLTGLPNRFRFNHKLEQWLSSADTNTDRLAVFFIDLDGFKHANDTLGHAEGDKLLVEVADRFSATLSDQYLLARLGGDEFALFTSGAKRLDYDATAQQLLDSLRAPFDLKQNTSVGASIGIALYPVDGTEAAQLVNKADQAMYNAKRSGKHQYKFYCQGEDTDISRLQGQNIAVRRAG